MAKANIEIRHLKYFIAVAELQNYRRAAQQLNISQPPLTRQIQQLEEELGVELFARKGRGVELTDAGRLFQAEAGKLLLLLDQAVDRVRAAGRGEIGRLDVGVFGSAILNVIPRLIDAFRARQPGVTVVLHDMNKVEQLAALRDGRIAIGFNRFLWDEPGIVKERILKEPLYLACPAASPAAARGRLSLAELRDLPFILYPRSSKFGFADKILSLCRKHGFTPQVVQEVDDVLTAISLVFSGFGVTLVAHSATNLQMPGLVFVPLEDDGESFVELHCIYKADARNPTLTAFLDIIRAYNTNRPMN